MSSDGWCTIESDPGVFTELIQNMGVKGVQVEELWSLEDSDFEPLKPVHGLIFLFKWSPEVKDTRPPMEYYDPDLFFANQVINNACATQAIISILLNSPNVDVGPELESFKSFTKDFDPQFRGLALSNSEVIRTAHNSFARPEPFVFSAPKEADEKDDVYHFIAYIPFKGKLLELDGLKPGPICLGDCTSENWLSVVRPEIYKRMEMYSQSEIRFNLLAICQNRSESILKSLQLLRVRSSLVKVKMLSLGASVTLDSDVGDMDVEDNDTLPTSLPELETELLRCQEQANQLTMELQQEQEKFKRWKSENVRRRHNYIPFIVDLLSMLASKGHLPQLVENAKRKQAEKPDADE
eukprot:GILI01008866.1.p1 GENE.GILI01008866.1~~GILI01008866.1.p1  ORF type:complete len:384 (-),score=72.26 GILI01008866.1:256-1311(-)